jgi:hypothetical protein
MKAYKASAVVTEYGLSIPNGLPLPVGASVEVIILDNRIDVFDEKSPASLAYLASSMTEWESAEDEFAYQDL